MISAPGFVVWFTGLSGAGKTTLATLLAAEVPRRALPAQVLDGDVLRATLSRELGFSREDRDTHVRRIGAAAAGIARTGACAVVAAISPYRAVRDEQRRAIGRFCEVHCECPLETLQRRDPKGLYARARAGVLRHLTGVDDPYEPPLSPEVVVRTDRESPSESLQKVVGALERLAYLPPR